MAEIRSGDEHDWCLQDDDTAIVYMCGVEWQHHTLGDPGGAIVYGTIATLKKARPCVDVDGIVEVEMKVRRWVQEQKI